MKTLFDVRPNTKRQRVPQKIVAELVARGVPEKTARALPFRAAFARLYALRRGTVALSPEDAARARVDEARKLRAGVADSDFCAADLTNLAVGVFALLNREELARVCAGLANLLDPVNPPQGP